MKSFIYGRHDVLEKARGYGVFAYDRNINRDTQKELNSCFASSDPDAALQQRLNQILVYFPLKTGEWVLGKAQVEERGDYQSYILHGLLLDETTRENVNYNPFLLADLLDPKIGNRRKLPDLPDPAPLLARSTHDSLLYSLKTCASDRASLLMQAGETATRILQDKEEGNLHFQYDNHFQAPFWFLVYSLLPLSCRRDLSLATLGDWVNRELHLNGGLGEGKQVYLPLNERTEFGTFLGTTARKGQADMKQNLNLLLDAVDDFHYWQGESELFEQTPPEYLEYMSKAVKAVGTPSIHSLKLWDRVPCFQNLFPWKKRHFMRIWMNYREEVGPDYHPNLDRRLLQSLKNSLILMDSATERALAPCYIGFGELAAELKATQKPVLIPVLLANRRLVERYLPYLAEDDFLQALFVDDLPTETFAQMLEDWLTKNNQWPDSFSDILGSRHFPYLNPGLHGRIFNYLNEEDLLYAIENTVEGFYLDHPPEFDLLCQAVTDKHTFLRLFLEYSHHAIVKRRSNTDLCDGLWQLVGVCKEVDEEHFSAIVSEWISCSDAEHMAPTLARFPQLFHFIIELWHQAVAGEWEEMRLFWIARYGYDSEHDFLKQLVSASEKPLTRLLLTSFSSKMGT